MTVVHPAAAFRGSPSTFDFNTLNRWFGVSRLHFPSPPDRFPYYSTRSHRNLSDPSSSPSPDDSLSSWKWDSAVRNAVNSAIRKFDSYVNCNTTNDTASFPAAEDNWDWDRWKRHFSELEEQEVLISTLKNQLDDVVEREDYGEAARLKVAVAAAAASDVVGRVMGDLKKAIQEERYEDAMSMQACAGTGLVGWWAGVADDPADPYGRIIHISAEHGKYVARSYNPWQLSVPTRSAGVPLFEIYLTKSSRGEYRKQVVYLERVCASAVHDSAATAQMPPPDDATSLSSGDGAEDGDDDLVDMGWVLSSLQKVLQDMIPGVKVKVMKVKSLDKVDRDLIHRALKQMMGGGDAGDRQPEDGRDIDDDDGHAGGRGNELAVKVFFGGLPHTASTPPPKTLQRLPARLSYSVRSRFTFSLEKTDLLFPTCKSRGKQNVNRIVFGLAKFIGKEKLPSKVIREIGELLNLTLNQARNHGGLSGSTAFTRLDVSSFTDPLDGLYVGVNGHYAMELVLLRRKFGCWHDDIARLDLDASDYVEAVRVTGDPYIPAGQVAFRAKIRKENQLPHRGIIPDEFGVIARYGAQVRVADRGFENARWVEGELVVLDGKNVKGDPLVGFVCWSPEHHMMLFFTRVNLREQF